MATQRLTFRFLLMALLAVLSLPAHPQSLGMLLQAGLVPGLGGKVLRLETGPLTGGESVDLVVLPATGGEAGGYLLGSGWGDLLYYPRGPAGVCLPPQVWVGTDPSEWQWPPLPRQVSPEVADWDGDGHLDLLLGWGGLLLWYPRVGPHMGAGQELRLADGSFVAQAVHTLSAASGHLAPCVADVDADGRPDLLLGGEEGSLCWARNTEETGFSLAAPQPVMTPTGPLRVAGRARPAWGDVDGDGRPDLIVGDAAGRLTVWPGMPTGLGPGAPLTMTADPPLLGAVSPRVEAEGRLLLGESGGFVRALSRAGDAWQDQGRLQGQQVPLDVGSAPAVSLVDVDGDERPDLLAGEAAGYVWYFAQQAGAPQGTFRAAQALTSDGHQPVIAEGGYAWPLLVAMAGSRDRDLLLGTGRGQVELWLRTRTLVRGSPLTAGAGPIQTAGPLTLSVADWDNDAKLDLFIGCHGEPALQTDNIQVQAGQIGVFLNAALVRGALPIFSKGSPLDVYCRRPGSSALGLLRGLGLTALVPVPGGVVPERFLALGERATFLLNCEVQPPQSPLLTLPLPENAPPVGLLPALYSAWVSSDEAGRPDLVFCGLREYGLVCTFPAAGLGLR
ncbi:MAG: VCBS repeat-containing protein [candidate division WS1 bacterium]|nr:VCBS repeat-containing protein [candidate division WS1 bacterium]